MAVEVKPDLERLLREEKIAWLTTMRSDGMSLPAPIWFLWQDSGFLFYRTPNQSKRTALPPGAMPTAIRGRPNSMERLDGPSW